MNWNVGAAITAAMQAQKRKDKVRMYTLILEQGEERREGQSDV